MSEDDVRALNYFLTHYPTWWWKIGCCDLTRDFDCAPQGHSPEFFEDMSLDGKFNNGFSCDHAGTIADAIHDVMGQIADELGR